MVTSGGGRSRGALPLWLLPPLSLPTVATVRPVFGTDVRRTPITITGPNLSRCHGTVGRPFAVVTDDGTTITGNAPAGTPAGLTNVVVTTAAVAVTGGFASVAAPPSRRRARLRDRRPVARPSPSPAPTSPVPRSPLAHPFTVVTDNGTTIPGNTPAGTAGLANVVVTTDGGTVTGGFTYVAAPPAVAAPPYATVSPSSGPTSGGTPITITGTNLSGATVTIGGAPFTVVTDNGTTITGNTPAGTAGLADVVVTTAGGTVTGGFTYVAASPRSRTPEARCRLFGRCHRRRGVRLRPSSLLWLDGGASSEQDRRRTRSNPRRKRLLAGGFRWRHLQCWGRQVLRLHG